MQHADVESDGVESSGGGHDDGVEHEGGRVVGVEENGFGVGEVGGGGGEGGAGEEAGDGERVGGEAGDDEVSMGLVEEGGGGESSEGLGERWVVELLYNPCCHLHVLVF